MADQKISELTNILGADVGAGDEFVVVDSSANETKAITTLELRTAIGNGDFTVTGDLTVQGTTITVDSATAQNIVLGDNDKMQFGDGNDLQIYSNGTNSFISESNATGSLFINASNLVLRNTSGEYYFYGNSDGAVNLYYDNASKLATTSTGIDVTGTVTADGLTVDGLVGIGRSPTSSPYSASEQIQIGDTGVIQSFNVDGYESLYLTENTRWDVTGYEQAIQTSEASKIRLWNGNIHFDLHDSVSAGANQTSWRNALHIANNGDISFYEDTGTTAKFFWDASAESLGIGTTSPQRELHIVSPTSSSGAQIRLENGEGYAEINADNNTMSMYVGGTSGITLDSSGNVGIGTSSLGYTGFADNLTIADSSNGGLTIRTGASAQGAIYFSDTTGDVAGQYAGFLVYNQSGNHMAFGTSSTEAMRIDSSGNVGIGTSSPSELLHVNGTIRSGVGTAADPSIKVGDNDTGFYYVGGNVLGVTTGGSEAMRIDSSGFLGLGTTAPDTNFHVYSATRNNVAVFESGDADVSVYLRDGNSTSISAVGIGATTDNLTLRAGNAERMRIDSSGNLLVGTTTTFPGAGNTASGSMIQDNGSAYFSRTTGYALGVNRNTSDGPIINFGKDGTSVGSIGTLSSRLHIENGDTGLRFAGDLDQIFPCGSGGGDRDAAIDLGSTGVRFKDLYLSGGVYLGGTGAANHLDDYEEGTHTCTVTMGSGSCSLYSNYDKIKYTKIGNLVTIQGQIRVESVSSPSGAMSVSMPFSIDTTDDEGSNLSGSLVRTYLGNAPTGGLFLHGTMVFNQGDKCNLQWSKSGSATVNHVPTAGEYLLFNFSYNVA